jgi:transposase
MNFSITIYDELKNAVQKVYTFLHLEKHEATTGRSLLITLVDSITLAIFKQKQNIATKKSLYEIVRPPCTYKTFVESINRAGMYLALFIALVIKTNRKAAHMIKFTDATDIPVCLVKNAKYNRTMRGLAAWSKTSVGWFYGLKLHWTADLEGRVLALRITPGNSDDRGVFKRMNELLRGIFVSDAGYISQKLEEEFFIENERITLITPRANMKKVATPIQTFLQSLRMRVETHFRTLKMFRGLVTSLPRSLNGMFTHYLAAITAYVMV